MDSSFSEDTLVCMDKQHFSQAMRCLISNAVKFTPAGGRITVNVTSDVDSIRICVTDSGVGMSLVGSIHFKSFNNMFV